MARATPSGQLGVSRNASSRRAHRSCARRAWQGSGQHRWRFSLFCGRGKTNGIKPCAAARLDSERQRQHNQRRADGPLERQVPGACAATRRCPQIGRSSPHRRKGRGNRPGRHSERRTRQSPVTRPRQSAPPCYSARQSLRPLWREHGLGDNRQADRRLLDVGLKERVYRIMVTRDQQERQPRPPTLSGPKSRRG